MTSESSSDADLFSTSDEALRTATGRPRADWFALRDAWGAAGKHHPAIAAWLVEEHALEPWWAQTATVDFERARGLRPKGGRRDGTFDANSSKTMEVPVRELFEAVVDPTRRAPWLPDADLREWTTRGADGGAPEGLLARAAGGARGSAGGQEGESPPHPGAGGPSRSPG